MNQKLTIIASLLTLSVFLTPSCDLIDLTDFIGGGTTPIVETGNLPADSLIAKIISISENAQAACDGDDNDATTRAILDAYIDALAALTPAQSETDKLDMVTGGWQQIWSDAPFTAFPGFCYDGDDIYQVVYEGGFYYNISNVATLGLDRVSYLRGEFEIDSAFLPVVFTNNFLAAGSLVPGTDLVELGQNAEDGNIEPVEIFSSIPFIDGNTGQLGNYYVDDEIRIVTDGATSAESAFIYILKRTDVVL